MMAPMHTLWFATRARAENNGGWVFSVVGRGKIEWRDWALISSSAVRKLKSRQLLELFVN